LIVIDMQDRIRRSARLYRVMLWLYPRAFRAAYGAEMRQTFESWLADESERDGVRGIRRVWRSTLAEIVPTVVREHAVEVMDFLNGGGAARGARMLAACAAPVGAYLVMRRFVAQEHDSIVLAIWFALMAGGMVRAGGRGWACNRNAMVAAGAGVGAPLIWVAVTQTTSPGVLGVAPLLIAAAMTIGLIVSTLVRLMIEGVRVRVENGLAL
jgi:hypothetical protein